MGGGDTRLGSVAVARNLLPSFDEHGVGKRLDSVGLLLDKHGYAIYAEGSKFPATLGYSLWIGITAAREALAPLQLTRPLTVRPPFVVPHAPTPPLKRCTAAPRVTAAGCGGGAARGVGARRGGSARVEASSLSRQRVTRTRGHALFCTRTVPTCAGVRRLALL